MVCTLPVMAVAVAVPLAESFKHAMQPHFHFISKAGRSACFRADGFALDRFRRLP